MNIVECINKANVDFNKKYDVDIKFVFDEDEKKYSVEWMWEKQLLKKIGLWLASSSLTAWLFVNTNKSKVKHDLFKNYQTIIVEKLKMHISNTIIEQFSIKSMRMFNDKLNEIVKENLKSKNLNPICFKNLMQKAWVEYFKSERPSFYSAEQASSEEIGALAEIIEENTIIKYLSINPKSSSTKAIKTLTKALERNTTLRELTVSGNIDKPLLTRLQKHMLKKDIFFKIKS